MALIAEKKHSWWTVVDNSLPHAHWLGIFHRPIQLEASLGGRLSIPDYQCSSVNGSVNIASTRLGSDNDSFTTTVAEQNSKGYIESWGGGIALPQNKLLLAKRLAYLLQIPTQLLLSPKGPLEWPEPLYDYQLYGVNALLSNKALLLADDMGLGKTIQAIAALRILVHERQIETVLLIVRASLLIQWRKELYRWAGELRVSTIRGLAAERAWQWETPAHVYLVSYETFRSDFTENPQSPPRRRIWDIVIIDEAQAIKNRDTVLSRKCKRLARQRAWALTGTPLENHEDELASILEFVTPLMQNESNPRLFAGPSLFERHCQLQLRRKKSEVLPQLPPKIISKIELPLEGQQLKCYEKAEREGIIQLKEKGETLRVENVLELILRLKQICNFCPSSGQSVKLEDLLDRLKTIVSEGHRALVFSQFTDSKYGVRAIANALQPFKPLIFTGDLSLPQREVVIREFKEDSSRKALVLSLRVGGQGLNLQDASYVFHFDRWWNPSVEQQAEDRSHRLGQMFPVHVYKYILENTFEERIEKIIERKQKLFKILIDDVSMDLKTSLSQEELFGLFGLKPPKHVKHHYRKDPGSG